MARAKTGALFSLQNQVIVGKCQPLVLPLGPVMDTRPEQCGGIIDRPTFYEDDALGFGSRRIGQNGRPAFPAELTKHGLARGAPILESCQLTCQFQIFACDGDNDRQSRARLLLAMDAVARHDCQRIAREPVTDVAAEAAPLHMRGQTLWGGSADPVRSCFGWPVVE